MVDDNSADDYSVFDNKALNDKIKIKRVLGNGNLWWGGSINKGISYIRKNHNLNINDNIIFANNDVLLNDKNTIHKIINILNSNPKYVIHPLVQEVNSKTPISSGANIISWFPFLTKHVKQTRKKYLDVDVMTARLLCFKMSLLNEIHGISKNLPHYNGDYDFALNAKKKGYIPLIYSGIILSLDDSQTGTKNYNTSSFKNMFNSFFTIKSPNNLKYKFYFMRNHKPFALSLLITINTIINTLVKTTYYLIKNKINRA